jgi:hypothetical protein
MRISHQTEGFERELADGMRNASAVWTNDCLPEESLLSFVERGGEHPEAAEIIRHISSCSYCSRGYFAMQEARSLAEQGSSSQLESQPLRTSWRESLRRLLAPPTLGFAMILVCAWAIRENLLMQAHKRELADAERSVRLLSKSLQADKEKISLWSSQLTDSKRKSNLQHREMEVLKKQLIALNERAKALAHASPQNPTRLIERDVVAVTDGKNQLRLKSNGSLTGLPPAFSSYRSAAERALKENKLQKPDMLLALLESDSGGPRGQQIESGSFRLLNPKSSVLMDSPGEFRWEKVAHAVHYTIEVFESDDKDSKVATKSSITETSWKPDGSLPRGVPLKWQVTAFDAMGTKIAFAPSPTPARFFILPKSETERLRHLAEHYSHNSFSLAVAYAHAGLVENARKELDKRLQKSKDPAEQTILSNLQTSLDNLNP